MQIYGCRNHNQVYVITLRLGGLKWEYVPMVVTRSILIDPECFEVNSKKANGASNSSGSLVMRRRGCGGRVSHFQVDAPEFATALRPGESGDSAERGISQCRPKLSMPPEISCVGWKSRAEDIRAAATAP